MPLTTDPSVDYSSSTIDGACLSMHVLRLRFEFVVATIESCSSTSSRGVANGSESLGCLNFEVYFLSFCCCLRQRDSSLASRSSTFFYLCLVICLGVFASDNYYPNASSIVAVDGETPAFRSRGEIPGEVSLISWCLWNWIWRSSDKARWCCVTRVFVDGLCGTYWISSVFWDGPSKIEVLIVCF